MLISRARGLSSENVDARCMVDFAPILTIKNFARIKMLKVTFERCVVIIGEQASGKSITCKLYYFFTQALKKITLLCLREECDFDAFKKRLAQEFCAIFPETAWRHDTFALEWESGELKMKVTHNRGNKRVKFQLFDYENHYERVLKKVAKINSRKHREDEFDFRWRFDRVLQKNVRSEFALPAVDYIPAGRSFFSTIQDTVFSLLSNNIGIDYFLKEFGQKLESFRRMGGYERFEMPRQYSTFEELCKKIVHGTYEFDGKEQWILDDKKHKVRLADASSGQQEVLPLLMVLARYKSWAQGRGGVKRIIIEEPEAHLYPTAQQQIIDFLGMLLRMSDSMGCIITTHSPFILCCVNSALRQMRKARRMMSAYHLHDGIGDFIVDEDSGLINAERFDDLSFSIAAS